MSESSARLGLPYLAAAQAQKHVTHNESLRRLDALVQLTLESVRAAEPPAEPAEGACWFVPAGATGVFSGHDGQLASFEAGSLEFLPVPVGCLAFIRDEWRVGLFDGQGWVSPLAATRNRAAIEAHVVEEDVPLSGDYTQTQCVIPARAIVFAVSTRTLTAVTGASSYDCGVPGERSKFGGMLGIGRGSSNEGVIGPTAYYSPTPVRLSANGGAFSGGLVRVAIHYFLCPVAGVSTGDELWWRGPSFLLDGHMPVLAADLSRERYVLNGEHRTAQDLFVRSGGAKQVAGVNGELGTVPANRLVFEQSGGRRRLLVEGAATNLMLHSAGFTGWAMQDVSITPEGAAFKMVPGTTNTMHYAQPGSFIPISAATSYVASIFLRAGEYAQARLSLAGVVTQWEAGLQPIAIYDLASGQVSGMGPGITAGMEPVGGGIWRCWICARTAADVSGSTRMTVWVRDPVAGNAFAGDGVGGLYIHHGAQMEVGTYPSSYIATGASAVTRVADQLAWSAAARALVSSAGPVTIALRFHSAETLNPDVIAPGVLGRTRAGSNHVFMNQSPVLVPDVSTPDDEFAVCFGWSGRERTLSQNGHAARSSQAGSDIPQPHGFSSSGVTHIDELVIWPVKGSAAAIQEQARTWA